MKLILMLLAVLSLASCDYTEVKREIGYKGKARINPWLAAERFSEQYEGTVRSLASWTRPEADDAVWFIPASILGNASFTRQIEEWVEYGGHLVVLVEHADAETSDWSSIPTDPQLSSALVDMLDRAGISLEDRDVTKDEITATKIEFDGETYEVDASSRTSVALHDGAPRVFASIECGDGRMTVLTDGRLFRNRWIDEKENASLLDALILATGYEGNIGFMRGSGLSLWGLMGQYLWPVLLGLGLLTVLWLWKNLARFGPVEAAADVPLLRGYEHHLEALGDFQWRLDRAVALLTPLRAQIIERGQHLSLRVGRRDEDFFQFLSDRAEIPRERVFRALAEAAPPDSAILTRTTADLQRLLLVLH